MTTSRRTPVPAPDDAVPSDVPAPRGSKRRPPGAQAVERSLRRAMREPAELEAAAHGLVHLTSAPVRDAIRAVWVKPDHEQLWRALARHAPRHVRGHCLELAAACRWGTR